MVVLFLLLLLLLLLFNDPMTPRLHFKIIGIFLRPLHYQKTLCLFAFSFLDRSRCYCYCCCCCFEILDHGACDRTFIQTCPSWLFGRAIRSTEVYHPKIIIEFDPCYWCYEIGRSRNRHGTKSFSTMMWTNFDIFR